MVFASPMNTGLLGFARQQVLHTALPRDDGQSEFAHYIDLDKVPCACGPVYGCGEGPGVA